MASHIKPWTASDNRERSAITNGICACPNHDRGFDRGLLSVDRGLRIQRAPILIGAIQANMEVAQIFGAEGMRESLLVPAGAYIPGSDFIGFHRQNVFRA
jgi:putative restriction endonuclease